MSINSTNHFYACCLPRRGASRCRHAGGVRIRVDPGHCTRPAANHLQVCLLPDYSSLNSGYRERWLGASAPPALACVPSPAAIWARVGQKLSCPIWMTSESPKCSKASFFWGSAHIAPPNPLAGAWCGGSTLPLPKNPTSCRALGFSPWVRAPRSHRVNAYHFNHWAQLYFDVM